jgi:hypothetical protein
MILIIMGIKSPDKEWKVGMDNIRFKDKAGVLFPFINHNGDVILSK